jgi:subtilisin family serine protease
VPHSHFAARSVVALYYRPGKDILSSSFSGGTEEKDGTSQAAPHVAGVAALYLEYDKTLSPQSIYDYIVINHAAMDQLTGLGDGSPNRLIQTTGLNDMVEEDDLDSDRPWWFLWFLWFLK